MVHLPLQKHSETVKLTIKLKTFEMLLFSANANNTNMCSGITVYNFITEKGRKNFL